jgi:hypothetical protein
MYKLSVFLALVAAAYGGNIVPAGLTYTSYAQPALRVRILKKRKCKGLCLVSKVLGEVRETN